MKVEEDTFGTYPAHCGSWTCLMRLIDWKIFAFLPGNKLHALRGDRAGFHAIAINGQWRICFRFEGEDAFGVEICTTITEEITEHRQHDA